MQRAVHRHMTVDEQLYKDIEGVLEMMCDAIKNLHEQNGGKELENSDFLKHLFEFLDGISWYFSGKSRPTKWIGLVLKTVKLFSSECRAESASKANVSSLYLLAKHCTQ